MVSIKNLIRNVLLGVGIAGLIYTISPKNGTPIADSLTRIPFKAKPTNGEAVTVSYNSNPLSYEQLIDENGDGNLEKACHSSGAPARGIMQICFTPEKDRFDYYQNFYSTLYPKARAVVPSGGIEIYRGIL